MHRNIKSSFLAVLVLVCLIFLSLSEAQLNFSTGWGKRSPKIRVDPGSIDCTTRGRPSLEQLLNLYSSIQIEARRLLECRKLTE